MSLADVGRIHLLGYSVTVIGRICETVRSAYIEPHMAALIVLQDTLAFIVHDAEAVLRLGETLLGGLALPSHPQM